MGGGRKGDHGVVDQADDGGGEGRKKKTTLPSNPSSPALRLNLSTAYLSVSIAHVNIVIYYPLPYYLRGGSSEESKPISDN